MVGAYISALVSAFEVKLQSRGGCVTVTVSSRVIRSLIKKIDKNVKTVEIDHNGAYLCEFKCFKLHLPWFNTKFVWFKCRNKHLKNLTKNEKWHRFVLLTLINPKIGHIDKIGLRKTIKSAKPCNNCLRPLQPCSKSPAKMTTETTASFFNKECHPSVFLFCFVLLICRLSQICSSARH